MADALRLVAAVALLCATCTFAQAPGQPSQVLYKLVDRNGKVVYSDKVPKGFDGDVTRIDVDAAPDLVRPALTPPPAAPQPGKPPLLDTNAARKAQRERLQADIDRAHVKLAAARQALADGGDPKEGEYQAIQQKFDASYAREGDAGPRPNCRKQVDANGVPFWLCPTIVPGGAFRDRQKELEEAVRAAEAELEVAQRTYRRNVD